MGQVEQAGIAGKSWDKTIAESLAPRKRRVEL
jgi:hypothetical protein